MNLDGQLRHILVVNDAPEILALMREIFEEEAFRVSTRINGDISLDEITRIAPDLIILDYNSGAESNLLHLLTADSPLDHVPIVLCTGARREVEIVKPELDTLRVAVVYKPFDIDVIVRVVREALGLDSYPEEYLPPKSE